MKPLPQLDNALVIRTDFSNQAAWDSLSKKITAPVGEYNANVSFVNDPEYKDISEAQVIELLELNPALEFLFIVDKKTLSHPETPIVVMDGYEELGRTFRVVPNEMWNVENNLTMANMDFDEFLDAVDEEGIFRGF